MTPSTEASTARTSVADRYRVLLDIGKTLTGMLSREDLYRAIYRETARVLEADGFYISLYDQENDLATIVFCADRGKDRRVEISFQGSDSEVLSSGQDFLVEDRVDSKVLMVVGETDGQPGPSQASLHVAAGLWLCHIHCPFHGVILPHRRGFRMVVGFRLPGLNRLLPLR